MLFMYIHTHPVEKCIVDKPQEISRMFLQQQEGAKKAGIKIVGTYVAPHEHTMFTIFEANDLGALEKALVPMTLWGDAQLIPIMTADQMSAR